MVKISTSSHNKDKNMRTWCVLFITNIVGVVENFLRLINVSDTKESHHVTLNAYSIKHASRKWKVQAAKPRTTPCRIGIPKISYFSLHFLGIISFN